MRRGEAAIDELEARQFLSAALPATVGLGGLTVPIISSPVQSAPVQTAPSQTTIVPTVPVTPVAAPSTPSAPISVQTDTVPTLPTIPNTAADGTPNPGTAYLITSYGASTGSSDNTDDIQAAITACDSAGGGTVEIPAGTFLCGPITLGNSTNLYLAAGAELEMLAYGNYPGGEGASSYTNFIVASHVSNIELSGTGTIDGQGSAWWTAFNANSAVGRPQLVEIDKCTDVEVQNITLQNSPKVHLYFTGANNNCTVQNITINAPGNTPNTEGVQVEGSNFLVENSTISDGDDNIAVNAGATPSSTPEDANITINNITCYTGHGISIGSETSGGVSNMTVTNCIFDNTSGVDGNFQNGIRFKSARGTGGVVQNITYSNITMEDVENPILIYSYYPTLPSSPTTDPGQALTSLTPTWFNITLSNITATWPPASAGNTYTYPAPSGSNDGVIWGLPEAPVGEDPQVSPVTTPGISLQNVNISAYNGMEIYHARNVTLTQDTFATTHNGNSPFFEYDATTHGAYSPPPAYKVPQTPTPQQVSPLGQNTPVYNSGASLAVPAPIAVLPDIVGEMPSNTLYGVSLNTLSSTFHSRGPAILLDARVLGWSV